MTSAKVSSIEYDGYDDVYNLEVEDTHCFAVNGGLIVHNCMDDIRYFANTILRKKIGKESYTTPTGWF